jgi:hypothetical protein
MVTPAQIEMTSFPSTAWLMPSSSRIVFATFGLELRDQHEQYAKSRTPSSTVTIVLYTPDGTSSAGTG